MGTAGGGWGPFHSTGLQVQALGRPQGPMELDPRWVKGFDGGQPGAGSRPPRECFLPWLTVLTSARAPTVLSCSSL